MIVKLKNIMNNALFSYSLYRHNNPICYHSVTKNRNDIFLDDNYIHNIYPEIFEQHIIRIKNKFEILPLEEYLDEITKKDLGTNSKITSITFDDGYKNIINEAYPILSSYNVPFTIFITTKLISGDLLWRDKIRIILLNDLVDDFREFLSINSQNLFNEINWNSFYYSTKSTDIDSKNLEYQSDLFLKEKNISINKSIYLNENDLNSLSVDLVSFGNHSHSHYNLASLKASDQREEIIKADKILSKYEDRFIKVFAVPFGGPLKYNKDTIKIVSDLDYQGIVFTKELISLKKRKKRPNNSFYLDKYNLKYTYRILPVNRKIY